jgi:hypothetical protein
VATLKGATLGLMAVRAVAVLLVLFSNCVEAGLAGDSFVDLGGAMRLIGTVVVIGVVTVEAVMSIPA